MSRLVAIADSHHLLVCESYRAVILQPKDRGAEIAALLLSPPLALRANDLVLRNLFERFHWLAVARVTCRLEYALELSKAYIRKLEFPSLSERESSDSTQNASLLWKQSVWDFVTKEYGKVDILAPPSCSADAARYCPRCCSQFTEAVEVCHECGICLMSFSKTG